MKDRDCIAFLRWALPRLGMRWAGFRKVRRQVCRRIDRRLLELNLGEIEAYQSYLETHAEEFKSLDDLCRITISRFYRDKGVFHAIEQSVLPELIRACSGTGASELRIWSAGCGSGEEPYTLAMIWRFCFASRYPKLRIRIQGTDADPLLLNRARRACYPPSSLKELPNPWRQKAFYTTDNLFCLRDEYKKDVIFLWQDIRNTTPQGLFHIILCRNLAFTYFTYETQNKILDRLSHKLHNEGALVIGIHENLPGDHPQLIEWTGKIRIFRKCCPSVQSR